MRFVSNCTLLASALSAAYRTYNDTQPISSLEHFLDDNGILLTMCMQFRGRIPWLECSRKDGNSKLSASWIQASKTRGFRVIGKPIDVGPPVGLVLKPSSTKVRCLYPVDAGTDGRDNNGCGPNSYDPRYGSKGYDHAGWFQRLLTRQELTYYKNQKFGKNRTWESIPCNQLYDNLTVPILGLLEERQQEQNTQTSHKNNQTRYQWKYKTLDEVVVDQWSYKLGHPVCNQSQPAPKPDFNETSIFDFLVYFDRYFWSGADDDWRQVVSLMEDTIDRHPFVSTWNELVLEVPPSFQDFVENTVQAVFCIQGRGLVPDQIAKFWARREAKKMNKPLLYVNEKSLGTDEAPRKEEETELFHCFDDDDDIEEESEDVMELMLEHAQESHSTPTRLRKSSA
ncbi:expressed unknown protein [Seminavis robusta]|uniref:Uncharacterized protein n=1 Tax=Seminavis robusta TaxID=568900 RepID=A0A9N8DA57_9STRA|nr:expressed unknown protein [Seminavis robusta]|eukprot:Sro53_g031620.1 n/a (396) ;mRNA; f:134809-135996